MKFFYMTILGFLTIIFSYLAIQNNKIAKEVAIKSFGLDKNKTMLHRANGSNGDGNFFSKKWSESFKKEWNSF